MATDFILGTAGHIDHGKTSLVRALTGIDTDRLPEEKRRGITIDLGFANLQVGKYRLGIVDVPGHERFVRNMLAGATGMDLAMLVIAADDSINQQTREHLDILRMLDLQAGVIALTKCDLVQPEWLELVEQEIRQFTRGTFLSQAPIIRTSIVSSLGLDNLRRELEAAASQAEKAGALNEAGPFRMPIDRTFTVAGYGTVVTGSVSSGCAKIGDELLIEPGGLSVRIRGLHHHDEAVEEVGRGQRAAINLAGVHHDVLRRGQELATPGHLVPAKLLTAQVTLLDSAAPLRARTRVRVHVGTAEVLATIVPLEKGNLLPGASGPAQLFLAEAVVTTWNQPLILRSESPVATIGGGRVLDPNAERVRNAEGEALAQFALWRSADPVERAGATLYFAGLRGWQARDLPRLAGVQDAGEARQKLLEVGILREISVSPTRTICLHALVIARLAARLAAALQTLHERHPLRSVFPQDMLFHGFEYFGEPAVFEAVVQFLESSGTIRRDGIGLALAGQGPQLSRNERALYTQTVSWFLAAGLQPPTVKECQQKAAKNQAAVPQLIELAVANGEFVEVGPDFVLHQQCERRARETIAAAEQMRTGSGMTMSEIRELLGTSRKYAVPLCEYWDRSGFTTRRGDLRTLS